MAEPTAGWGTEALAAVGAASAGLGVAAKAALDWLGSRRAQRTSSEDLVRDDLLSMVREQREQIRALYAELEAMRVAIRECEDRAIGFQRDLADLRAAIHKGSAP